MKCGWVSLRVCWIYFAIWTQLSLQWKEKKSGDIGNKLAVWDSFAQKGDASDLNDFLKRADVNAEELLDIIRQHLNEPVNTFDYYFTEYEDPCNGNLWIKNPFTDAVNTCELNLLE